MKGPTERFSDRVENYAKYRPGYPDALLECLRHIVPPPAIVADVGSGTGILTRQLLNAGYDLYALEPNDPMRSEAERTLSGYPSFHSVAGTAEATTLPDRSVDLITCAQAFHWFERLKTKSEFQRILRADRPVAIIWNERIDDASELNRKYDDVLKRLAPEYLKVDHRKVRSEDIEAFFVPGEVSLVNFPNEQQLDREGFLGRLLSSSFVPNVDQPGYQDIVDAAGGLFEEYQVDGRVTLVYETKLYLGRFG